MQSYDREFITAARKLLMLIEGHQLATPLAISWRNFYGSPPTLHVQIEPECFKSWLDELDGAVLSGFDDEHEHTHHMHAEGALRLDADVRVHIVAVVDSVTS